MKSKSYFPVILCAAMIAFAVGCPGEEAETADKLTWLTDLPQAQTKAKADHKWAMVDFTGSDWCPACIQLHNKVFASDEFAAFAQTNLVMVKIDFPNRKPQSSDLKKANKELAEKFGVDGFPTIILLDSDGKKLDEMIGYSGETPSQVIDNLKKWEAK